MTEVVWKRFSGEIRACGVPINFCQNVLFVYPTLNWRGAWPICLITVYPKKYAHGFVVLCFVVVMQSFIMNSHEVFIHIHQGCFAGTGAIVRLPQCQWSKPDGYGKISQCITTTKHSEAKTVCIFLGIYCMVWFWWINMGTKGRWPYYLHIYCDLVLLTRRTGWSLFFSISCRPNSRLTFDIDF